MRDLPIALRFPGEFVEIVKPIRVQQPKARKMAGHAELLWRGSEQQQAGSLAAKGLDHGVFRTDSPR